MQDKHLFEYAVIRVVPRVEREEFLNVGIILFCVKQKFLQVKYTLNEDRLRAFSPDLDIDELKSYLHSIDQICQGTEQGGPIGKLDTASRFRWLTAARSTIVQTSKVHPGLCKAEAHDTLEKLYTELVL